MRSDEGAVTAEFAVAMPAVVLLIVAILVAGIAGSTYLACADAARVAARSVSAGDSFEVAEALVTTALGPTADTSVEIATGWIRVTVSRPVANLLGGLVVTATAVTRFEPGSGP